MSNAPIKEILTKLDLATNNKLKNAAVILFCKEEQKQFMQSMLSMARFNGIDKSEFVTEKSVRGNAFDLYEAAVQFLTTYLPVAGKSKRVIHFAYKRLQFPIRIARGDYQCTLSSY